MNLKIKMEEFVSNIPIVILDENFDYWMLKEMCNYPSFSNKWKDNSFFHTMMNRKKTEMMEEFLKWLIQFPRHPDLTMEEMTNLKWLYLNNNNLTSIPQSIGYLTNLQTLYLSNNNLTSIPSSLLNKDKLYMTI